MPRHRQLASFIALISMTIAGGAVRAEAPDNPPTLAAPSVPALQIKGIQLTVAGTLLKLNDKTYLLPEGAAIRWEDGSPASRDALAPGMRIRIKTHLAAEVIIIDQLTILAN